MSHIKIFNHDGTRKGRALLPSSTDKDRVTVVALDMENSKINVLSSALMAELDATLDALLANPPKLAIFISLKEGSFIIGADLQGVVALQRQPSTASYEVTMHGRALFSKIEKLPCPSVAIINGTCLGGGAELTLPCTYRIAIDSPQTRIGLPEVGLGFLPGWGGNTRLPKMIGLANALDLILSPLKSWDAKKAWRNGLVDELAAANNKPMWLVDRAMEIALERKAPKRFKQPLKARAIRFAMESNKLGRLLTAKMAAHKIRSGTKDQFPAPPGWPMFFLHALIKSEDKAMRVIVNDSRANYPAPLSALKVAVASLTMPQDKCFEYESRLWAKLAVTPQSRNLVGMFFADQESKKAPNNAKPTIEIKKVGVMGAGLMGSGIAHAALAAGYDVVMYDMSQKSLENGIAAITKIFKERVAKGRMTEDELKLTMLKLTATGSMQPLANCDIVVEAIIEDMRVKKDALAALEKVIAKDFIFATNTSSLSVTEMCAGARKPENTGGLHFFSPVHKMLEVEVVAGKQTSSATVAALKAFAMKLGKKTVVTADAPGFVVNRILVPYMYEAFRLAEAGVPMKDIDDAMKRFGMPMGPFELCDNVGLPVCVKVFEVLHASLGDRIKPPKLLAFVKEKKLVGKTTKEGEASNGIHLWDKKGKNAGFNPEFVAALPEPTNKKSAGEIQDRLSLIIINEAIRCLEENIVNQASQLDLAMIFATGFPPFRGGPLRLADSIGAKTLCQKLEWLAQVAGDNYKPTSLLKAMADKGESFYG